MSQQIFYPDLKIVPLTDIKLQEYVQASRMQKLAQSIKKEGILRNPPIVTNFTNGTYLHLDGANRITAASLLKYPHCLVQVVDYSDPTHVHLMSWSHLAQVNKDSFLKKVHDLKDVSIKELKSFSHRLLLKPQVACMLVFADGSVYEVSIRSGFIEFVRAIGAIVDLYADTSVERVFSASPWTTESIIDRFERYTGNNLFVAFPNFSPHQVISLVDQGVLMPAGITRHVVYRRKLNVNLPLSYLSIMPIEKANEQLQKFLQHRSVRLYEEPVIYFE